MNILVINAGSSSIKYKVFEMHSEKMLKKGIAEELQGASAYVTALQAILTEISDITIHAIGHRVVHGGENFKQAEWITKGVIEEIEACSSLAPLHNPPNLAGIKACMEVFPDLPHIAVFDTAFHASLPRRASTYAIDHALASKHQLKRYGFHGNSHQFVSHKAAETLETPLNELKLVSLHLGNGASACAIEYGHSTETSMGMTPLEGLVMGTRCGDIDPGLILHLAQDLDMPLDEINTLLNKQSGLKGLSGISNDLREIETAAEEGNDRARLAIAVYAHSIKKYIGAYAATMGGMDGIILTGGIGENSAAMRQRILQRLDFLGVKFDETLNMECVISHESPVFRISAPHSRVHVFVIKTNEELMIARQTLSIAESRQKVQQSRGIPISVSARHAHLSRESFKQLFDKDKPTHYKDLLQPGQYACEETINLIGPRGKIEKVRLLGPLRSKNQIEISRTDEFTLGVDAPVRDSGQTKNSAPIIIEGPAGELHLTEGLICARRHIHMHPDDAEFFGVKDKDEVEVAITGGPRDLIFCDVLIRVSPGYALEMHIDTDEANAAELTAKTDGHLVYTGVDTAEARLRVKKT